MRILSTLSALDDRKRRGERYPLEAGNRERLTDFLRWGVFMITQEELKELLEYNPETGAFTWIKRKARCVRIGDVAGYLTTDGYRRIGLSKIGVGRKLYFAHVLAWFYVNGTWPVCLIDHIDRNKDNNALSNLRPANQTQNRANAKMLSTNKSGFRGVYRMDPKTSGKKWRARIAVNGKLKHVGAFDTPEEASAAYNKAAFELWGEFYHKAS